MKVGLVPARVIQVQGAEAGSPAELSCPGDALFPARSDAGASEPHAAVVLNRRVEFM